jgi:protein TonB
MRWPEFMAGMDPSSRSFTFALGLSIVLHAVALSIHFKLPDIILDQYLSPPLEVVLVNSKTRAKPVKADVLAQANLEGGGNTDENRRAKTPLPVLKEAELGADAKRAARRVQELEAQQLKMMTQLQAAKSVTAEQLKPVPTPESPQSQATGQDLASSALDIVRLEAQLARRTEEYNKRPKRKAITARVREVVYAMYYTQWREKIERTGDLNYPEAAKGKAYSLMMTVSVKDDGSIEKVQIDRSSGMQVIDQAALNIVKMAAPFSRFPAQMSEKYQVFDIVATWTFTRSDKLTTE